MGAASSRSLPFVLLIEHPAEAGVHSEKTEQRCKGEPLWRSFPRLTRIVTLKQLLPTLCGRKG
jgi:hypothetical protein